MSEFKIDFEMDCETVKKKIKNYFRNYNFSVDKGRELFLYAFIGKLWIEVNNKNIFEISSDGFQKLISDGYLPKNSSQYYLNNTALDCWFYELVGGAKEILIKRKKTTIEYLDDPLKIDITPFNNKVLFTFGYDHAYNKFKHFIHKIKDEIIPFSVFIEEVIRSSNEFLSKILEINPILKDGGDIQEFIKEIEELKQLWNKEKEKYK